MKNALISISAAFASYYSQKYAQQEEYNKLNAYMIALRSKPPMQRLVECAYCGRGRYSAVGNCEGCAATKVK